MLVLLLFVTGFLIVRQFVFQLDPEPIQLDKPNVSVEQLKLAAAEASSHLGRVCGIFAVVALLIGILSRLLVVALFKRRHRMTRAEMEAELREMEAAPQFSGARQNLLD